MKKIMLAICFICAGMILGFSTTTMEAADPVRVGDEERQICRTSTGNCVTATIVHSCDDESCPKL